LTNPQFWNANTCAALHLAQRRRITNGRISRIPGFIRDIRIENPMTLKTPRRSILFNNQRYTKTARRLRSSRSAQIRAFVIVDGFLKVV